MGYRSFRRGNRIMKEELDESLFERLSIGRNSLIDRISKKLKVDKKAAEIIYDWYDNEDAFGDFSNTRDFLDFLEDDIYDMLDAASNKSEKAIVKKALNVEDDEDEDEYEEDEYDEDKDDEEINIPHDIISVPEKELDIQDIFLLSAKEYEKYRNLISDIKAWWWLRTPSNISGPHFVSCVKYDTYITNLGRTVDLSYFSVRPALRISNLESFDVKPSDIIEIFDREWIVLDKDLVIAEDSIGKHRFDEESNDYETSEIRQYLYDWLEEQEARYGIKSTQISENFKDNLDESLFVEDSNKSLYEFINRRRSAGPVISKEQAKKDSGQFPDYGSFRDYGLYQDALEKVYGIYKFQDEVEDLYEEATSYLDSEKGYRAYYELEKLIVDNKLNKSILYDLASEFAWDDRLNKAVNKLAEKEGRTDLIEPEDADESLSEDLETNKYNNEHLTNLERELYQLLKEHRIYPEDGTFIREKRGPSNLKLMLYISGDWKHDHLFTQDLVEEFCDEHNITIIKHEQQEIGNSESDSYEAEHTWYLSDMYSKKDIEGFRQLFKPIDESLFVESNDYYTYKNKKELGWRIKLDLEEYLDKALPELDLSNSVNIIDTDENLSDFIIDITYVLDKNYANKITHYVYRFCKEHDISILDIYRDEDYVGSEWKSIGTQYFIAVDFKGNLDESLLVEGTNKKRIARYGENSNYHILRQWKNLTDEEAEEEAKNLSIKDKNNIYYVEHDDIYEPNSNICWYRGNDYPIRDMFFNRILKEDLKTDKEELKIKEEETPDETPDMKDNGVASLIIAAINDEWNTIKMYNDLIVNLEYFDHENKEDFVNVIQDITKEENIHIGQLQKLLSIISPTTDNIANGEDEAAEQLDESFEEEEKGYWKGNIYVPETDEYGRPYLPKEFWEDWD